MVVKRDLDNKASDINILYISYDGILEPLGQSQVLRYLEKLSLNHSIYLISYEKPEDWAKTTKRKALKKHMQNVGIDWIPLKYHKRFSGLVTAFDIIQGIIFGSWVVIRYRIQIVHARSYVSAVIALVLKKVFSVKFIFDMRGFWADERVDGGIWPDKGRMYKTAKWFEKRFLLNADSVISLTHSAVKEMKKFPYLQGNIPRFDVITTCTDLELFKPSEPAIKKGMNPSLFTLGYVGSVGVWYLFEETLRCFKKLQRQIPGARLHIINRGEHDYIHEQISKQDIALDSILIEAADHVGVAKAMQGMDAGVFFIKPVYSKQASAPTKLGEFLGCGVPCMGNKKIGDMAGILEGERVGVALDGFFDSEMEEGVSRLIELARDTHIIQRCRQAAVKHFSLEKGVAAYDRVYKEILHQT